MIEQATLHFTTARRQLLDITTAVRDVVTGSKASRGLCNIYIQHTSASLIISENADPEVGRDLERFMMRLAPDGDALFEHDAEGPDDMPAHVRTVLTNVSLTIPIRDGDLMLGTWQGIYLWEHRHHSHQRSVVVTLYGD